MLIFSANSFNMTLSCPQGFSAPLSCNFFFEFSRHQQHKHRTKVTSRKKIRAANLLMSAPMLALFWTVDIEPKQVGLRHISVVMFNAPVMIAGIQVESSCHRSDSCRSTFSPRMCRSRPKAHDVQHARGVRRARHARGDPALQRSKRVP